MAKRTVTNAARSTLVVLTLLVGVLFAGYNFAFADVVSTTIEQTDNQSISQSVDSFLTGGVDQDISSSSQDEQNSDLVDTASSTVDIDVSSTATSTAVGGNATTDTDIATTTGATTTSPFLDETSTSTLSFDTGSTTNATSTSTTTGSVATTTPDMGEVATSTNATSTATTTTPVATSTTTNIATSTEATTTAPSLGGFGDTATSTASTSPMNLKLLTSTSTDALLAASTTATTTQSFRVKYYRYDDFRTDMAGWGIPFDEIQGIDPSDPLATSWTKDWFTSAFLKNTRTEENIRFKDRFTPFAESTDPLSDSESYIAAPNFGAHFMGFATVSEEGDYTVTITTDGDTWFYVDRVLQLKNLSGIKPAETLTKTIHMVPGQRYVLNMFFTERIALYPYFDFSFPGVTITPCDDDSCIPGELDPDTTGPSAPVVTAPVPPTSSTTTNITIPIAWTDSVDPEISGAITSGLRGYIFVWDENSTTTPTLAIGTLTTSTSTVMTNLTPGIWWFHVVAIDNAGNTSAPTTHHGPFCIGLVSCGDTPPESGPFEIRDLRVTDISQTSLVVRWRTTNSSGTDHAASSRVVYDLMSQGATTTTPNYGYAYSTSVSDENPLVVEHAVTITGLSANTAYYFRGISVDSLSTVVSSEINATTLSVPPVNPPSGGGGGGHSSGSSRVISSTPVATTTPTLPAVCRPYLLKYIKFGADNDPVEVLKLQAFLKVFEGRNDIPLDGIYGTATYNAVKDFQKKYGLDVLNPWGIGDSTGYVFITTTIKINYIYCGNPARITLNLRNFYPNVGGGYYAGAQKGQTVETLAGATSTGTSTFAVLPLATSTLMASGTKNSVQLAFAGIAGFLLHYPWVWILLLLCLIVFIVWISRSKEDEQPEVEEDKTSDA